MCISAIVEANGLYLEPVLHAIAEQLPSLWERAQDSVTIHSSLVSGESSLAFIYCCMRNCNNLQSLMIFNLYY